MTIAIAIIFLSAALLGTFLLTYLIKRKETPKGLVLLHGFFALSGITALLVYAIHSPTYKHHIFLLLFILVASGGIMAAFKDFTNKPIPKGLVLAHGSLAFIIILLWLIYA